MRKYAGKYAEIVIERGGNLRKCVGFIDRTKVKITRPGGYYRQRSVYSGHKRMHCLLIEL